MNRRQGTVLLCGALVAVAAAAEAREEFLRKLEADPFRSAETVCGSCHVSETGGGELNEFGSAFDDEGQAVTPMLRASFPDQFGFYSTKLADGSTFHFSDPDSELVVFEREGEKYVIDLAAITIKPEDIIPPPANRMTFFVTSVGMGNGGHLEGLAGADRHCQALAEAVGAGSETWRAYLSTSFGDRAAVNAGDRIGTGPWFNAKGQLLARGVAELHAESRFSKETVLNEKGEIVNGRGDEPNRHDILTGSLSDGTAAIGKNCNNWTSSSDDATAMVGHHDREGGGEAGSSWSSAHESRGCSQEAFQASGGDGLFYCFALRRTLGPAATPDEP